MKTIKITHFFDVIKKEVTQEPDKAATTTKNNESDLKIKIKQELDIKEEIDLPWDESNDIVDKDNIYSLQKYNPILNPRVILDKLPNSIVQKYVKSGNNNPDIHENMPICTKLHEPEIIPEKLTVQIDGNAENKKLRNKTNLNKTDDNYYDSQFYWKTCTACNKKYEIVRNKHKMHDCQICNTRLIYECKKCHRQLTSLTGIRYHIRSKCVNRGYYFKCFECNYKSANKGSVVCHIRFKHPAMTSEMHSRIVKIECENVQTDLDKAKYKCSKCEKKFEFLSNLLRHCQSCLGKACKTDDESQDLIDLKSVRVQIILHCEKCNCEMMYTDSIGRNNSIENAKLFKKRCPRCNSTMRNFKCAECNREYASRYGITGHIKAIHNTTQKYKCPKCDYESHVLENLVNHYRYRHISEIYKCSKCGMKLNSYYNLIKHLHECGLHPGYNCEHCSYKSHSRATFTNHVHGRHMAESLIGCPKCKCMFKNKLCMKAHLGSCEKPFVLQCDYCSYKTKYKSSLIGHLLRIHSAVNKKECPNCKKMFKNEQSLKDHSRYCNQKNALQCKFCSYKTRYPAVLRNHSLRLHEKKNDSYLSVRQPTNSCSNQKTYQCDHCPYKAKIKGDIYQHIIMRHLKEKNIECRRCNAKFKNSVYLSQHLKYCGLKSFLHCDQCSFKTYLKGQLTEHTKRKHMNYECTKCNRTFKRKDGLNHHLKHTCKKLKAS